MLVVDRVVLHRFEEIGEVVGFGDEHSALPEHMLDTAYQAAEPGNVRKHVRCRHDRCMAMLLDDPLRDPFVEEFLQGRYAVPDGDPCDVGRFDAQDPNALFLERAQQGAVIRTDVDGQVA